MPMASAVLGPTPVIVIKSLPADLKPLTKRDIMLNISTKNAVSVHSDIGS